MKGKVKNYEVSLDLENDVNLKMLFFDNFGQGWDEHRWIFNHNYKGEEGEKGKPIITNETKLIVDYKDGISQNCELTMNVYFPERLEKEYFVGVDISPNSHHFLQFLYKKQNNGFLMDEIRVGVDKTIKRDEMLEMKNQDKQGLVKLAVFDFPFPLKDLILNDYGKYEVPFLNKENEESFFTFPEEYIKK